MLDMRDDHHSDVDCSRWSVDFTEAQPLLVASDQRGLEKRAKQKVWSNVSALVVAMGIFSIGLNPIDDLQSTLNAAGGLGIKYASAIVANLLFTTLLIHKMGAKRAQVVGAVFYCLYVVANFYPIWESLVPLTVIAGLGGALLWTAVSSYLARMAVFYADLIDDPKDRVLSLFFSALNTAGFMSAALGGLISFFVLGTGFSLAHEFPASIDAVCGSSYCNEEVFEDDEVPTLNHGLTMGAVFGICGFCLGVTLFAVVMMGVLVHPLSSVGIVDRKGEGGSSSSCRLLLATVRLWCNKKLLLLVPMTLAYGCQETFWRVEFSRAYIACPFGIHYVGLLMVLYNIAALVSSFLCGWMGSLVKRGVTVILVGLLSVGSLLFLFRWDPFSKDLLVTVIITAVSGLAHGALSTLLLVAFPNTPEAAYSNMYFWSFLGSIVMWAFSFSLCLKVKLLVVVSLFLLGLFGYESAEMIIATEEQNEIARRAREYREIVTRRMLVPAGF